MRRTATAALALGATAAGLLTALPAGAAGRTAAPAPTGAAAPAPKPAAVKWKSCGDETYTKLQCGSLKVPLDHSKPSGRQITLALSRVPATAKKKQGPLLVNPGGPGGSGLTLAGFVADILPKKVASQYDVVGFDPRGVGRSEPALDCRKGHFEPLRLDSVPRDPGDVRANLQRAEKFAKGCGKKYGTTVLNAMNTRNAARDVDRIRAALGAGRISYFGYSYGTYLGAVYADLFPTRVRRLVLDSVVDPTGVWYEDNVDQNHAFDANHRAFLAWVAKNDAAYGLGRDPAKVERAWYAMRESVRRKPAGGVVGAAELEDTFLPGGYYNGYWPLLADGFAKYVKKKDGKALKELYASFGYTQDTNGYSVYSAVQCRDAAWPEWGAWQRETRRTYAKAPFLAWNNTWYNAPCAFWPTKPLRPTDVANDDIPPALIIQSTDDAATPYSGAVTMHELIRGSRLVVEEGGRNHAVSLSGNTCLDGHLADYLATGALPASRRGPDATCAALPDPKPPAAKDGAKGSQGASPKAAPSGKSSQRAVPGSGEAAEPGAVLHRLVGRV